MYDHPDQHQPSETPVLGCPECDKEIERPLVLCFGAGSSSLVIPRKPDKDNDES